MQTAQEYQRWGKKYDPDKEEDPDIDQSHIIDNAVLKTSDPQVRDILLSHLQKDERQFTNTTDGVLNRIRNAVKWYGKEDAPKDWMTTLDTATESNPEYEGGAEDVEIHAPETLQTLFSHLESAPQPTAYQVVFEPKAPWEQEATSRKADIRSGQLDAPVLERIFDASNDEADRDLKAYEYRRIKLIENKRPRKTFHTNIRAISLTPEGDEPLGNDSTSAQEEIDKTLDNMVPLLDPLDGVYYSISGSRAPAERGFFDHEWTADEVVTHFFEQDIIKIEDDRSIIGHIDPWDNRRKHPEIIVNGRELGELIVIPSGDDMDNDVFRSTGTKSKEIEPLRRPRPEIHREFNDGLALGYAYTENGVPEQTPTCLPEHKLNNHWAMFGASGSGKTVNTISMLLSAYADTAGPTIVIDPKQGDMMENYSKAHYARFGDIDDVYIFSVPETLPAIPFFDIRPYLYEGGNRDDAIQQKVDQFHMIMEMIDSNYSTAYVAKTVLGALIKSQFDLRHGQDNYTLDDLYDAAMSLYVEQDVPRVSHQPQVARIFQNQINKGEQEFKNTMQAVVNRLDDLQEDINLYRLFNQNPEWDDDLGTYKTNFETDDENTDDSEQTGDDEETVNHEADADTNADEPHSALDFRQFLNEDCVILFDTGSLVRDESQQAFSMYILSALWGSVRARYNDLESHESIDATTKIVIEESSPIVSTELVTNTLIPEAREFGLSLGMIMQYPSQVKSSGVEGSFGELQNNVETKIYGHIEAGREIADSLVHDEKDTTTIKNKIRRLGGGEWIVDLPAPTFDLEVPPPFSLTSLEIPAGHPESEQPLTPLEREAFSDEFTNRKDNTRIQHGVKRLSAEELAAQNSVGARDGRV